MQGTAEQATSVQARTNRKVWRLDSSNTAKPLSVIYLSHPSTAALFFFSLLATDLGAAQVGTPCLFR